MNSEQRSAPAGGPALSRRGFLGAGLGMGTALILAACGSSATAGSFDMSGTPSPGGRLRVGLTGGGATDTLDAHLSVNTTDIARVVNLYDTLLELDHEYGLQPGLATKAEVTPDGRVWTVHLRDDVVFHDGRPMTGRDVKATFLRITDPDDPKNGAVDLQPLREIEVVGEHLVRFHLDTPVSYFDRLLAAYTSGIVPVDYDPQRPVGTGPFRYKSFTASQQSTFARNEHYWHDDQPYLDELTILNFNDDDALINALLSNQVDAIGQIPPALVEVLESDPRIDILNSETGSWTPFTMRVDQAPFDDNRVREAFRLAVDREQMVRQVYSGHGRVGNDMYAPFDSAYSKNLPQRTQDLDKARRLLAEAGHPDGITVELVTSNIQAGAVEAAQVFAQQAKGAGITVDIRRVEPTTFFGDDYLKWTFAQDFYYTRDFLPQAMTCSLPKSAFNETHMDNPELTRLVKQATATVDEGPRTELIRRAQKILYDEGGYIIWGFANQIDAYQRYVGGLVPDRTGLALSGFRFRQVWMREAQ
ncbi:ABC transporter substrate-binding protein [Tomitella gaofuii]|uniref:ABC transporter substrate-binding protein n=1 Tax=Tomitella gaofuii TaxID=2760083 RepID=UPI0015FC9EA3|nr:ABC transporter substrate-binding protein [Tomitella gaofuii]